MSDVTVTVTGGDPFDHLLVHVAGQPEPTLEDDVRAVRGFIEARTARLHDIGDAPALRAMSALGRIESGVRVGDELREALRAMRWDAQIVADDVLYPGRVRLEWLTERIDHILAAAVLAAPSTEPCPNCDDRGWTIGHENECHETGDCNCSGVQIPCDCDGARAMAGSIEAPAVDTAEGGLP